MNQDHDVRLLKLMSGEEIFAEIKSNEKGDGFLVYRPALIDEEEVGQILIKDWINYSEQELYFFKNSSLMLDPIGVTEHMVKHYLQWSKDKSDWLDEKRRSTKPKKKSESSSTTIH